LRRAKSTSAILERESHSLIYVSSAACAARDQHALHKRTPLQFDTFGHPQKFIDVALQL
jgi:hypothetical protein